MKPSQPKKNVKKVVKQPIKKTWAIPPGQVAN